MNCAKSVPFICADCRGGGDLQHGFVMVSSKTCREQAITLALWTQMKAAGVPHEDSLLARSWLLRCLG